VVVVFCVEFLLFFVYNDGVFSGGWRGGGGGGGDDDCWLHHLRPAVRMEHFGSHWTEFHKIWYLSVLRKSIEKIQVSSNSHKNNGYLT